MNAATNKKRLAVQPQFDIFSTTTATTTTGTKQEQKPKKLYGNHLDLPTPPELTLAHCYVYHDFRPQCFDFAKQHPSVRFIFLWYTRKQLQIIGQDFLTNEYIQCLFPQGADSFCLDRTVIIPLPQENSKGQLLIDSIGNQFFNNGVCLSEIALEYVQTNNS